MSEVSKLKIVSYKDSTSYERIGEFNLQLNPVKISIVRSVDDKSSSSKSDGNSSSSKSEVFRAAKYTFTFTLDDTGALNMQLPNQSGVAQSISTLESLTVMPNNETHQNPYIYLYWGETFQDAYFGQVTALKYNYTYFDIAGNPLRAEITLTITEVNAPFDRNFQSPDITKMPLIKKMDNIVKFSLDSYDSKKYYIRIAQVNNLCSLRDMKVGKTMFLPPIEK